MAARATGMHDIKINAILNISIFASETKNEVQGPPGATTPRIFYHTKAAFAIILVD